MVLNNSQGKQINFAMLIFDSHLFLFPFTTKLEEDPKEIQGGIPFQKIRHFLFSMGRGGE